MEHIIISTTATGSSDAMIEAAEYLARIENVSYETAEQAILDGIVEVVYA